MALTGYSLAFCFTEVSRLRDGMKEAALSGVLKLPWSKPTIASTLPVCRLTVARMFENQSLKEIMFFPTGSWALSWINVFDLKNCSPYRIASFDDSSWLVKHDDGRIVRVDGTLQ